MGNDSLSGDSGNDTLYGQVGNDLLMAVKVSIDSMVELGMINLFLTQPS